MDRQVLFSLTLCANRSFSKLDVSFRCAGAVFWKAACSRCRAIWICDPGVVALRCPAWQARHSVCADAVFVGPVVQSARFGGPEACQNWSTCSRCGAVHILRRKVNLLRTLGGSNRSRSGAVRILSAPGCRFRGKCVTLTQRDRSRCGAARILRT